jgi:site-specific DNA-methyltransferase (adenine-specific)
VKPYYEHGGVTIYHGDCRDVVSSLSPDVTITDPPYAERTHAGARSGSAVDERLIQFKSITDDEYQAIAEMLMTATKRWVVMTCDWRHAIRIEQSIGLVRLGVWVKPNGAPQFTGDRPGHGWEAVAVLHRDGKKQWNGGGHHAVWTYPIEQGEHPTQKPLRLVKRWVADFSNRGETILDPFMGSGTTLRAAKDLGRNAIGIEIEERYCEIAAKRLGQEVFDFSEATA